MPDLFATDVLSPVPMPGADVRYSPSVDLQVPPDSLLYSLRDETPWRQEEVVVWGKRHLQPRLVAWFGDPGRRYSYSGIELTPLAWTETLQFVREKIEAVCGAAFNSVLLNYYRDNRDSMGMHSDDERELGPRPAIASISLGQTRTLVFKSKSKPQLTRKLPLSSGSLLLMAGDTQANWKHGIEKEALPCGPRINLTFRRIITHS